ncbi:TdeIII family type II restriction endonuclease [Halothece sp. PCC 7418]|uniref:TdeIII family type II restriction endonuclease n=1 Tax=Halothece sp. (strain PCC 7418) TaxID=65093 RepID=UPI000687F1E8|nr:TdeIII family type II restriction endonuclease [Halothece sp. PCC 7418]
MSYNPYGSSREDYKWSYARNYMPFDDMVLIGEEFWNLIGGESAFEQLLNIYREVGEEKRKYLIEALAFNSP